MKKQTYIPWLKTCLIFSLLTLVTSTVFASSVKGIANKGESLNELGERVTTVEVHCTKASSTPRFIVRKEGEVTWCSQDDQDECSRYQLRVANKVCRASFSNELDNVAKSNAEVEDQLAKNQANIEKQRILLELEQLQIQRQELEEAKRKLELQKQQ